MKKVSLLVIHGSNRRLGLTERLTERILTALDEKTTITRFVVRNLSVQHCLACLGCAETGSCVLHDDMDPLYRALEEADAVLLTTPVYFNHVSSRLKQVIDRLEPYFYRKMKLKITPKSKSFYLVCSSGVLLKEEAKKGIISTVDILTKAFNSHLAHVVWIEETDRREEESLRLRYETEFLAVSDAIRTLSAE